MRLKFWKKQPPAAEPPTVREETPEPETPAPTATTRDRLNDPEFSARMLMANPALFLELERGERRREHREYRELEMERNGDNGSKPTTPLHAHEITPNDAALINMMAGAHFGDDARITLPSGRTITGAEMRRWVND